jgi:hypothetical protein
MKKKETKPLGASALQIILGLALTCISAILFAASFGSSGGGAGPTAPEPNVPVMAMSIEKVRPAVFNGDVRNLPQVPQREIERPELEEPVSLKHLLPEAVTGQKAEPNIPLAPMPAPTQNFPGLKRTDLCVGGQCGGGTPPDTNGAVGPNHYIQAVNTAFAIYDKTGNLLASFTENALWAGSGAPQCDGSAGGDPVVIYDALADRWILTNLGFTGNGTVGPFYECMAVSQTNDPVSGGWYLYAIRTDTGASGQPPVNTINDYPKFGVWTDCLYYAANGFNSAGSYIGGEFASFSRSDMYAGLPLTGALGFAASTSDFFTMIPSDLEAPIVGAYDGTPPAGRPNFYVQESLTAFNYRVRTFTAGTNCGGGGTLSAATTVSQTSYTGSGTRVPQPNTTNTLDTLFDRMMQKVQYRKVGTTESLWVVHDSQNSGATNRPQWAQINVTGGTIVTTPVQQQIYGPDTTIHRWMPSIAADIQGNVALGYSTSNATSPNFPSIKYSGRLAGDPLNTLPQTETTLVAGVDSQSGNCGSSVCTRWGDYASMSVDPSDGCTFWYTSEYFDTVGDGSNTPPIWTTRIGSFKFPDCVAPGGSPSPTPTATATATATSTPTATATATATFTPTATATFTPTPEPTATFTPTATATFTPTATATFTPTPEPTATFTPTATATATFTPTATATFTPTATATFTPTASATFTPTATATFTPTATATFTPTATATFTPTATATATATATPTAGCNHSITSGDRTWFVGVAGSYQITVDSGNPKNYSAVGLPPGLNVSTQTGVIAGTPTTMGTYPVALSAHFSNCTATKNVTFTVASPTATPTPTATATATATPTAAPTATPTATVAPSPTPTATPGQIMLTANGYKVNGIDTVDLFWSGATSSSVDIYRNGVLLTTRPNIGHYTDSTGLRGHGTLTYKVCEAGTQNCSNQVTITF